MDEHHEEDAPWAPWLYVLGPAARAEFERSRARPEFALLDIRDRPGAEVVPGVARTPTFVVCAIDPVDEDALPALEAAVREGRAKTAHALIVLVPRGRLNEERRRRIATHLGVCVLAAGPGQTAMVDAALALAASMMSQGLTGFYLEGVTAILRAGCTGQVWRANVGDTTVDRGDEAFSATTTTVIAVVTRAHELENPFGRIERFFERLDAALPEFAAGMIGTPDALSGQPGDITLFIAEDDEASADADLEANEPAPPCGDPAP